VVKHARRVYERAYIATPFGEVATRARSKALDQTLKAKSEATLQELRKIS
jgi:hypothetical protein